MAVFRIEKTRDYTVMSNHHLKDRTLTLKSKGLLSMMLSLPDEWNYTMPLKQLAPLLYKIFGVESKDCYRFYTDIKRRKNESRTYFLDRMQEKTEAYRRINRSKSALFIFTGRRCEDGCFSY